jgi:NNP family nitrate/nitrite transporter-like MFS transporter
LLLEELTMNNAAALYFKEDEFGRPTAAAIAASIFGWMNLFARGFGGYFSDKANAKMECVDASLSKPFCSSFRGALVLVFANTSSLGGAIAVMIVFSALSRLLRGSTFCIVPYRPGEHWIHFWYRRCWWKLWCC